MATIELKQPLWKKITTEFYDVRVPAMSNLATGYDYSIWEMLENEYGAKRHRAYQNNLQDFLEFKNDEDAVAFKLKWG